MAFRLARDIFRPKTNLRGPHIQYAPRHGEKADRPEVNKPRLSRG